MGRLASESAKTRPGRIDVRPEGIYGNWRERRAASTGAGRSEMFARITAAALLGVVLLFGCKDVETKLPGGYVLGRTESLPKDHYLITKADGTVVVPYSVAEIAVRGALVFGRVEKAPPPPGFENEPSEWTVPGYFVLDTLNGAVRLGLTEGDWIADLRARGIVEPPRLATSQGFDRRSSANRVEK